MDANITQSFIDMVEAYKAKPELESQIKQLRDDVEFFERNLRIEENITSNLKAEIERLNTSLSEVKKERDDAMFRSLELEDKFSGIEKLLGVAERLEQARQAEHIATVDAMTPPPMAVPENHPVWNSEPQGLSEPTPYIPTGPIDPVVVEPQPNFDGPAIPDQGQSAADPTMSDGNVSEAGTSIPTEPSFDQYEESTWKGQPYGNKPWWVEDDRWYVAGGMLA